MQATEMQQEALQHALQSQSVSNYAAIFSGFSEKGIADSDIKPRENVFTFNAWKALGRSVRKGEHGVKVCTWVPMSKKDADGVSQPIGRKPRMTTVFHISQTEAIPGASAHKAVVMEQSRETGRSINKQVSEMQAGYYSTEFTPI